MLKDWGMDWRIGLQDALISNALLAGVCIVISNILRFYRPQKHLYLYLLVICGAMTGLWGGVIKFGLGELFSHNTVYTDFIDRSMPVRFDIAFLVSGCAAMMSMLWYNLQEQKENEQRKADAEKLARDAELYRLQQQLQPHFLFNSLNSISALAGTQPQLARKMIQQLAEFLRGTLRKEDHQWVTLQEELQHLELYLEIEKVRFSHRLDTEIIADKESIQCRLPAMLLQPIVENAIKFGLYDTTEKITIRIRSVCIENYLVITVENPFDPQTAAPAGTGFGLRSIQRRLYLLFARNDLLETMSAGEIFTTRIKLPQVL
ncbi:MAG: histidine kinase [Chitinophagaceae bacterium]|nr:histidine kinase [Chitinophagaceae bacterium]